MFTLPTNGGDALVVIAAILFQLTLPLTPAQVLWINLVTSATLGLALRTRRAARDGPPAAPTETITAIRNNHCCPRSSYGE